MNLIRKIIVEVTMNKKIAALILALAFGTLAFTACGNDDKKESKSSSQSQTEQVESNKAEASESKSSGSGETAPKQSSSEKTENNRQ